MGVLDLDAVGAPDGSRLVEREQVGRRLISWAAWSEGDVATGVRSVNPAAFGEWRGDADQLVVVREDTWRVAKSRRETDGTFVERGADQVGHLMGFLGRGCRPVGAHDCGADGPVADQLRDIEGESALGQHVE